MNYSEKQGCFGFWLLWALLMTLKLINIDSCLPRWPTKSYSPRKQSSIRCLKHWVAQWTRWLPARCKVGGSPDKWLSGLSLTISQHKQISSFQGPWKGIKIHLYTELNSTILQLSTIMPGLAFWGSWSLQLTCSHIALQVLNIGPWLLHLFLPT